MANSLDFTKSQLEKLKQILEYPNDFKYPLGTKVVADDPEFLNKEGLGGEWKQIEGAFIFGASDSYPADGVVRGEAKVVLTKGQMPRHRHDSEYGYAFVNKPNGYRYCSSESVSIGNNGYKINSTTVTNATGGGFLTLNYDGNSEAHENMPPYIAKYMWIKTKLESETNGILEIYV